MSKQVSVRKITVLLSCGLIGCVLMAGSDWLMIYGDTAFEGTLAWLTVGVSQIAPARNAAALALAFPAVVFYALALFGIRGFLKQPGHRKIYCGLTAIGLTPWLCIHLFYVMILFLFSWMHANGHTELALGACEALFSQFSWMLIVGQVFMILPFLYLLWAFAAKKSIFPPLMLLNNPLFFYVLLKLVVKVLPDVPFRLAFLNGLMSESMMIWFVIFLIFAPRYLRKATAD